MRDGILDIGCWIGSNDYQKRCPINIAGRKIRISVGYGYGSGIISMDAHIVRDLGNGYVCI